MSLLLLSNNTENNDENKTYLIFILQKIIELSGIVTYIVLYNKYIVYKK